MKLIFLAILPFLMEAGPYCADDGHTIAVSCCACRFPLVLLCQDHEKKHETSHQGFHFILPLSAQDIITSEAVHLNATQWLFRLNSNFTVLKKKSAQVSRCGDEINAVCGELLHFAEVATDQAKRDFSIVKDGFNATVTQAIAEIKTRALTYGRCESTNPLAKLLWDSDPEYLSGYQMFTFQAKSEEDHFDIVFKVEVPGLERFSYKSPERKRDVEIDRIGKELENAKSGLKTERERSISLDTAVQRLTQQLQDKEKQLKSIQETCAKQDRQNSSLVQQVTDIEKQSKYKLDLSSAEVIRLQTEVEVLRDEIATKDQNYETLEQEKGLLLQQVQDLQRLLDASRANLLMVLKELNEGGIYFPNRPEPVRLLLSVLKDEIRSLDVTSGEWRRLFPLESPINCDEFSSATFMGEDKVFVCGGGIYGSVGIFYIEAFIIDSNARTFQLPSMRVPRKFQGIVYDSYNGAVYVFGGWNKGESGFSALRSCEKIGNVSFTWEALPDMNESRSRFNPCMCSWVVYLCGGNVTSVETFNPMTNTFTLLPEFKLPEANNCLAVVDSGHIVVISWNFICKWSLQEKKVSVCERHQGFSSWSNFIPAVDGETVYIIDLPNVCRCVSLRTGAVAQEITYN